MLTKRAIEDNIAEIIAQEKLKDIQDDKQIELPTTYEVDELKYKTEQSERYLQAASNFLQRSFEYAKTVDLSNKIDLIDLSDNDEDSDKKSKDKGKIYESLKANVALDPTHPKVLDLASFRMIILADETYELFFAKTLRSSIYVNKDYSAGVSNNSRGNALRCMLDGIVADGRRVAQQVRLRVDSVTSRGGSAAASSVDHSMQSSTEVANSSYDDIDDFTNDGNEATHTHIMDVVSDDEEKGALLKNSWLDEEISNETPSSELTDGPKKRPVSVIVPDGQVHLIDFEE